MYINVELKLKKMETITNEIVLKSVGSVVTLTGYVYPMYADLKTYDDSEGVKAKFNEIERNGEFFNALTDQEWATLISNQIIASKDMMYYLKMTEKDFIERRMTQMGWEYGGTGGGCDAYFKYFDTRDERDIEHSDKRHFMLTENCDANVPEKINAEIAIGVYTESDNGTWDEATIVCQLKDLLSGRIQILARDIDY